MTLLPDLCIFPAFQLSEHKLSPLGCFAKSYGHPWFLFLCCTSTVLETAPKTCLEPDPFSQPPPLSFAEFLKSSPKLCLPMVHFPHVSEGGHLQHKFICVTHSIAHTPWFLIYLKWHPRFYKSSPCCLSNFISSPVDGWPLLTVIKLSLLVCGHSKPCSYHSLGLFFPGHHGLFPNQLSVQMSPFPWNLLILPSSTSLSLAFPLVGNKRETLVLYVRLSVKLLI